MSPEHDQNSPLKNDPDGPSGPVAFFLYVALAVLLTWPLALHLGDRLPGGNNDLFQNYWNFWWWQTSVQERGELPYSTDLFFGGTDTSLAFHTHSPANMIWTAPAWLFGSPALALNLATLGGFVLAAFGAYFLARELFGDRRAAFLAGIVFAFVPQHFEQSLEHLNLSSYGAMPLFLAYVIRGTRSGSWRDWMLCAFWFAVNSLFSWHNGLMIVPAALLVFAFELAMTSAPRREVLTRASVAGVVTVLLVLPFAWPMISEMLDGANYFHKGKVHKPIDPFFLVVPSSQHPIWGSLTDELYAEYRSYRSVGFTAYVGLAAVALVVSGLFVRGRGESESNESGEARPLRERLAPLVCATIFLGYLALSFGSKLRFQKVDYDVSLPFALVEEAPLFKTLRVANRFLIPAMIGLALLVAWSGRTWLARAEARGRAKAVFLVLVGVLTLDFLWLPYPMRDLPKPDWLSTLEKAPEGPVLNVPGGHRARAADDMYLQTMHGRPIVGGYVSASPPYVAELLESYPFLQTIHEAERSPSYRDLPADPELAKLVEGLDVGTVVVHRHRTREWLSEKRAEISDPLAKRYYNPEKGMRDVKQREVIETLEKLWGPPAYRDDAVLIFFRPAPD